MNEKLIELVYDYSINGKIADKNFYYKAISIIVTYSKLDKFVNQIEFTKDEDSYSYSTRTLRFSDKAIYEYAMMYWYHNSKTKYFMINLEILMIILHEIEHVKQEKYSVEHKNYKYDLYRFLIECSSVYYNSKAKEKFDCKDIDYDFYMVNHGYFPIERFANILSAKGIYDLTMQDKVFSTSLRNHFKNFYWKDCFRYYKNNGQIIESPLENFFAIIGASESILDDKDLFKGKHSFEEKLLYGLWVNDKDYSRLTKKIHK